MRLCEQKTTGHTYCLGIQWIIWEIVIDCNTKIGNKTTVQKIRKLYKPKHPAILCTPLYMKFWSKIWLQENKKNRYSRNLEKAGSLSLHDQRIPFFMRAECYGKNYGSRSRHMQSIIEIHKREIEMK